MQRPLFLSLILLSVLPLSGCDAHKDTPAPGVSRNALENAKSLLRGELAAVTTYEDVIKRNDKTEWAAGLTTILDDHKASAAKLRAHVVALGGDPEMGSGAWGGWTDLVAKGAALIGDETGRAALEKGEKQGVDAYEHALNDSDTDADTKTMIRGDLLERTRSHIQSLQGMHG